MAISIDIPAELESSLRRDIRDLNQTAKEALLIDLYRQRRITEAQLAHALSLSRFKVDELLKRHGAFYDLTAAQVSQEAQDLHQLRDSHVDRR